MMVDRRNGAPLDGEDPWVTDRGGKRDGNDKKRGLFGEDHAVENTEGKRKGSGLKNEPMAGCGWVKT